MPNNDMSKFHALRKLSSIGYGVTFASIYGFFTIPLPPAFWIASAFVGSLLIVAKNRRIINEKFRRFFMLADMVAALGLIVLLYVVPKYWGLVRSALAFVYFLLYFWYYVRLLFDGKLLKQN